MRILHSLEKAVNNLIGRAIINLVNDSTKCQQVQIEIYKDEPRDDIEHFQPYGLSFKPPAGSEVIALAPGGDQSHIIAICATYRAHRPTAINDGEGGLYNSTGFKFFVDENDVVNLAAKTAAASLTRDDRLQTELALIKTALDTIAAAAGSANSYAPTNSTACDRVKGT